MTKSPFFEITGEIAGIGKAKQVTERFRTRALWLKYDDSYESGGNHVEKINTPEFKFTQKWVDELDAFKKGNKVTFKFKIDGRKWEKDGRSGVFTSLEAWDIRESVENSEPQPAPVQVSDLADSDDLPF